MTIKTKRYAAGEYEVTGNGRTWTIEQVCKINADAPTDRSWMLCEVTKNGKEYWNHFDTKRRAMFAIEANL